MIPGVAANANATNLQTSSVTTSCAKGKGAKGAKGAKGKGAKEKGKGKGKGRGNKGKGKGKGNSWTQQESSWREKTYCQAVVNGVECWSYWQDHTGEDHHDICRWCSHAAGQNGGAYVHKVFGPSNTFYKHSRNQSRANEAYIVPSGMPQHGRQGQPKILHTKPMAWCRGIRIRGCHREGHHQPKYEVRLRESCLPRL